MAFYFWTNLWNLKQNVSKHSDSHWKMDAYHTYIDIYNIYYSFTMMLSLNLMSRINSSTLFLLNSIFSIIVFKYSFFISASIASSLRSCNASCNELILSSNSSLSGIDCFNSLICNLQN